MCIPHYAYSCNSSSSMNVKYKYSSILGNYPSLRWALKRAGDCRKGKVEVKWLEVNKTWKCETEQSLLQFQARKHNLGHVISHLVTTYLVMELLIPIVVTKKGLPVMCHLQVVEEQKIASAFLWRAKKNRKRRRDTIYKKRKWWTELLKRYRAGMKRFLQWRWAVFFNEGFLKVPFSQEGKFCTLKWANAVQTQNGWTCCCLTLLTRFCCCYFIFRMGVCGGVWGVGKGSFRTTFLGSWE